MKKGMILISLSFILILSLGSVSASLFSDFWNKVTGQAAKEDNANLVDSFKKDAKSINQTYYTLSVYKNGSGIVISNPLGINCGSSCIYNFIRI